MALMIELESQLENQLREVAAQNGMDASAYARQLIERDLALFEANRKSLWNTLTPEEWMRAFDEWAQSHDTSIPPLPDEAVSRESFYEGRP